MERSNLEIVALFILGLRYAPQEVADVKNRGRQIVARASCPVKAWHLLLVWLLIVVAAAASAFVAQDRSDLLALGGLSVLLAGTALGLAGFRQLGRSYSAELVLYPENRLVSEGIYRLIRHPIRLGLALETLGLILISGQLGLIALWLMYCWGLVCRSRAEDRFLRKHFGKEAVRYQETVPAANLFAGFMRLWHLTRSTRVSAAGCSKRPEQIPDGDFSVPPDG